MAKTHLTRPIAQYNSYYKLLKKKKKKKKKK